MSFRAFVVCAAVVTIFKCAEPQRDPPKHLPDPFYIVFLDMTRSLNDMQQKSIRESLAQLCAGMPPRSHIKVIPLGGYVHHAGVLFEGTLPDSQFAVQAAELKNRRNALPTKIIAAAENYNKAITNREFLAHTCVSDALRHAEQLIRASAYERIEIIFISDMLEDCDRSLLGGPLSLERRHIGAELARARRLDPSKKLLDLRNATVTALVPATGPTSPRVAGPDVPDLAEFWSLVLAHCHHNSAQFHLETFVPERLGRRNATSSSR